MRSGPGGDLCCGTGAARVGDGGSEILVRVDGGVADTNLVVEVRTGGAAAHADISDDLASDHGLAVHDGESGHVSIAGLDAVAVVEDDFAAVAVDHLG